MATEFRAEFIRGVSVRQVPVRPQLGPDLTVQDGRVDLVVVDALLRGEFVPRVTAEELDEVLQILTEMRLRFHGDHAILPGRRFNDNSPYSETLDAVGHALGETYDEMVARLDRYRDKLRARARRERRDRERSA